MLISRETNGNLVEVFYESSNIPYSKYDTEKKELVIVFNGGVEYIYEGVSLKDYTIFETAESQGVVFNKYIKNDYSFNKGEKVDVVGLKRRLNEAKVSELNGISDDLVVLFEEYISHVNGPNTMNMRMNILKDIKRLIPIYEERNNKLNG